MQDGVRALLAVCFQFFCLLCLAGLMRLPSYCSNQQTRLLLGLIVSTVLLVVQPLIYYTKTQMHGLILVPFGCLAAWSVLHWTLLVPSGSSSVLEVVLSPFTHAAEGVIKTFRRRSGLQTEVQQQAQESKQQLVGDIQHPTTQDLWYMLLDATATLGVVYVTYDVGTHLLCSYSNGMCSSSTPLSQPSFWAKCAFAFPAGILLTHQVDISYCVLRLIYILLAFKSQALAQLVAQLPPRAFHWPIAATSVSELWGVRWHQFLRFYLEGLGYATADAICDAIMPPQQSKLSASRGAARCICAFAFSGLLHEYMMWAAFDGQMGRHLLFFMLNCAAVLAENWAPTLLAAGMEKCRQPGHNTSAGCPGRPCTAPPTKDGPANAAAAVHHRAVKPHVGQAVQLMAPVWLKRVWVIGVLSLLGPLFIEPIRAAGNFSSRAFHLLGFPLTPVVLDYLQVPTLGITLLA